MKHTTDLYTRLQPIIASIARASARRWSADVTDLEQHGWVVALEALPNFDPERGVALEHYLRRILARQLTKHAVHSMSVVRPGKGGRPIWPAALTDEAGSETPESLLARRGDVEAVRIALSGVRGETREALLSEGEVKPRHLAEEPEGRRYWYREFANAKSLVREAMIGRT